MSHDSYIRAAASKLAPGQKTRVVCPFCNASHEKSFDVLRRADKPWRISFRCYRGTCSDNEGFLDDRQAAGMVLTGGDAPQTERLPLTEHDLAPQWLLREFEGQYHIPVEELKRQGVRYSRAGHALCMPWLDEEMVQVGWVEKRTDKAFPKSHHDRTMLPEEMGSLAFPRIGRSYEYLPSTAIGVLVESMLDAYRVNVEAAMRGLDICAVALLGAELTRADTLRLVDIFPRIMVCLDHNMWPKGSMRIVKQLRAYPVSAGATTLTADPKDADSEAFDELFARCMEL